ncbi:glycosyltransferase family 39 protein [Sodalinema gerasimenkoae]|uniref:glycosyltransferase family 39 protein n=1 Tax=Sodalinema gerasimenkoae TaxID=2862348 RepID=UPI00135A3429|nr:glycosyltransferase family 39 protein [Sodalinema gerasimenkoae]
MFIKLFAWFLLGLGIRLMGLGTLPPWTDECATLAFSLGNSFLEVPLNQLIAPELLLEPLQPSPGARLGEVWQHLMAESTHPPLYFFLTHLWLQPFIGASPERLLWASRAFSALWGALTIPAMYGLGKRAFGSVTVAHLAAALMALSPLGVFLAQEARHYTLAILLAIASFYGFTLALDALVDPNSPARRWMWGWTSLWILVNGLGIAVHYFFGLVPLMQGLVLGNHWLQGRVPRTAKPWRGVAVAALGTAATGLVWLPVWGRFVDSDLTDWVTDGQLGVLDSLGRTLLWLISMVLMAPLDLFVLPLWGLVLGAAGLLLALGALGYLLCRYRGKTRPQVRIYWEVLITGLLLLLGLTYSTGNDLTLAPRFFFPLLPVVLLLMAAMLESAWQRQPKQVFSLGLVALVGSLSVVTNLSYLQNHRGDRLAEMIQNTSDVPVVLATTHKHHGQTGRLQAIAWELRRLNFSPPLAVALAHPDEQHYPTDVLAQELATLSPPFDVWYVNFHAPQVGDLERQNLTAIPIPREQFQSVNGYRYDLVQYR